MLISDNVTIMINLCSYLISNLIKCSPCFHSFVKTEAKSGRIQEQISENPRPGQRFSPAHKFSPGYEGTENMFYFFYKIIIFSFNKR